MSVMEAYTPEPARPAPTWWPATDDARRRIVEATGPVRLRWCPWTPTVKQEAGLRIMAGEMLYGGSAGGGKSVFQLMAAAQFVDVPGYRALILRRTFGELDQPGGLMEMAHQWWDGTAARWNQGRHEWTFPSGAKVRFGHMATPKSMTLYQGGGYHYVGYEEATHFTEQQYEYLHSRTRRLAETPTTIGAIGRLAASPDGVTAATVPIRMRATANPGNVGHEWVKTRFVDPQTRPPGVFFLRARLEDNDYLDQLSYIGTLMHLDPITRRQLLEGDWDVVPGGTLIMPGVFGFFDAPSPAARMARAWDLAATRVTPGVADDPDWTVGTRIHRTTSDEFEIVDVVGIRDEAGAVERLVGSTAAADGRRVVIGVPRDPGQAGKQQVDHFRRRVLRGYTVYEMPTTKAKAKRAEPFAAAANNGLVSIQRADWTSFVVRQYTGFPFTGHDDHLDSAADAHQLAAGGGSVNVAAPPRRRVNPTIGR